MQVFGEGLGQAVRQGREQYAGIIVVFGLEAHHDVRVVARGDAESANPVLPRGRNKVGQRQVWALIGFFHLLAQREEGRGARRSGLVRPDGDVIAIRIGWPETDHAARLEHILIDDTLEHDLRIGEQVPGCGSTHLIVENLRVAPLDLPAGEEGRPVDIVDQVGHAGSDFAGPGEGRFGSRVVSPVGFEPLRPRLCDRHAGLAGLVARAHFADPRIVVAVAFEKLCASGVREQLRDNAHCAARIIDVQDRSLGIGRLYLDRCMNRAGRCPADEQRPGKVQTLHFARDVDHFVQ